MGTPATITSPWTWQAGDYQGNTITITVTFNNSTRALTGASVVRQAGCVYGHLYVGQGSDGSPNTTLNVFAVSVGTTNVSGGNLTKHGLSVIEDVLALQITAGV